MRDRRAADQAQDRIAVAQRIRQPAQRHHAAAFAAQVPIGRRVEGPRGPELRRAADAAKDQSYFLFATTQDQLDFLRFPLGHLNKDETRALAEQFNLRVAAKPDSQDLCFIARDHREFLRERHPEVAYVQFVDGDSRIDEGWPSTGRSYLEAHADTAVVAGAVAGGGLTIIANAPNPATPAVIRMASLQASAGRAAPQSPL